jgi:predicted dienelactone hydrolase
MYARKLFGAIIVCLIATLAQAAGLRTIDIAADAGGPALEGAVWYPCSQPPGEVDLGKISLPGVKDCPLPDKRLPLIVVSHGRTGTFAGHHDIAEALADAGFIVAAINHAGDTSADLSRTDDLSIYVQRPNDIKRLIDFMLGTPPLASSIDRDRIGLFGFSRGGYTALAVIGANPDWANRHRTLQGIQDPCLRSSSRQGIPGIRDARCADQGRRHRRPAQRVLYR